ncbi:MAG: ATP-binding protein [Flavobacterium nitrogenifigens]|uniref:ATP-binding protein n=1 Tax=Flavobacterium nitrogenifigens TaxID=1617283 RepID=UPI002806A667|nr:ATP-binding protein [Flavobacterium nitrogenifigens]MDQ8012010.1 ATP-binding protein [Flavobacterium nitrogenifigens]
MDHSTKQEIVKKLVAYMDEHKMSQADVASKAGVRKEYLSIILQENSSFMYNAGNGKMGAIPFKHFLNLATLCGYNAEPVYWQIQPTPQMEATLRYLQDAKENSQTIVMIGETGSGKTLITKLFASKNPIDTFIITAGSSDNLNDLLNKMLEALSIAIPYSSKSAKITAIAERLKRLTYSDYKPMMIIDESEYLKQAALCANKEIHDYIHEYCSLVFVGTDQLIANIEKLRKKNKQGIPQFHRRIKFGLRVLPNIDRGFIEFIDEIEDKELKQFIHRNCNNYGELHDLLVPVRREAERLKVAVTMSLVREVLNLPDGNLAWH